MEVDRQTDEIVLNPKHVTQLMRAVIEDTNLRDLELISGLDGQKFAVHRLIMMSSCEYFRNLLGPNFREGQEKVVTIADIDGVSLKSIIDYCYTGEVVVTAANVMQMVLPAASMGFVEIEKECEQYWWNNVTASNCLEMFVMADKFGFHAVRRKCFDYIRVLFELLPTDDLQSLQYPYFSELLKSVDIHVAEDVVFNRLVLWSEYTEENRDKYVTALFELIHMDKLSAEFLSDVVEPFAEKHNCFDQVLYEYRRRTLSGETNRTHSVPRNINIPKCLFAATYHKRTLTVFRFDLIAKTWNEINRMTVGVSPKRNGYLLVSNENCIFCVGLHSPVSYTFIRSIDAKFIETVPRRPKIFCMGKSGIVPVQLFNNVYCFGGKKRSAATNSCECYSLTTNKNTVIQSMPTARWNYAAAVLNGKIYVVGGENVPLIPLDTVECYDPVAGLWTTKPPLIRARSGFCLFEVQGELYAVGSSTVVEKYNPWQNEWTEVGSLDNFGNIKQIIVWENDIYVLLNSGQLQKMEIGFPCSLKQVNSSVDINRVLFVNSQ